MPIDREDGRHWCDPGSETADENGSWTCPCGQTWVFTPEYSLWETPEDRKVRVETMRMAAEAEAVQAEEQG